MSLFTDPALNKPSMGRFVGVCLIAVYTLIVVAGFVFKLAIPDPAVNLLWGGIGLAIGMKGIGTLGQISLTKKE